MLDVWVPGVAKTKGSVESIGGGRVRQSVSGSTTWANLVMRTVKERVAQGRAMVVPRRQPVSVRLVFRLPPSGSADPVRERIGDVDKLERNILDALTAKPRLGYLGVYVDDVQVVKLASVRVVGQPAGCHIVVHALSTSYMDALTSQAEISSWFAYREATDPTFEHEPCAPFGHDCMDAGCGL